MKTAFLFPGQGSQAPGMGHDLFETAPEARARFDQADEVLGFGLSRLMFGDDVEALRPTDITQPALYVHSLAALAVLESRGFTPDAAAGHSLGEYSALAAAGALSFEDGLRLVRLRGELMAQAGEKRPGAMAALLGVTDEQADVLCIRVSDGEDGLVQPANYNAPGQIVISGDVDAVEAAIALAPACGARRAVRLPVGGAFHSLLMAYARDGLADALTQVPLVTPRYPVYLNVTAAPTQEPDLIRQRLLEQLMAPVKWAHTLVQMQADGITRFVEVGTGNVLTGLVRRTIGRDAVTATAGTMAEIDALVI